LRILYVATDVAVPGTKGSSTHTIELSSGLAALGAEVIVLSRRTSRQQSEEETLDRVLFRRVFRGIVHPLEGVGARPGTASRRAGLKGRIYDAYLWLIHSTYCGALATRIIRKNRIDIILERGSSLGAGAIASKLTGKPLVLEVIDRRHSRLSLKLARKTIAYRREILKADLPPDMLAIIPAGANTELFKESRKQEIDLVGYAGSFRAWHGVEDLVRAGRALRDMGQVARFIMVGPGCEEAVRLAETLGVTDAFTFTGALPYEQIPRQLARCAMLVAPFNPSKDPYMRKHGFIFSPLKIFEYMAMGKPVVATDVEKVRDVVWNLRTGILVQPGDPKSLADALDMLIRNPDTGIRMGRLARKTIVSHYSWRRLSQLILAILAGSIGKRSGAELSG